MTTDIWAPVECEMSCLQYGGGIVTGHGGCCWFMLPLWIGLDGKEGI